MGMHSLPVQLSFLADVLIIHIFEDESVISLVEKLIKDIC